MVSRRARRACAILLLTGSIAASSVAFAADAGETSDPFAPDIGQSATPQVPAAADPAVREASDPAITLVFAGDTGLNGSGQPVRPDGALRHGRRIPWAKIVENIRPLLVGDLAFGNLETVVTDRNDIPASEKAFAFRSHPDGVRHLVNAGFTVFSGANNHVYDYGEAGLRQTIEHLADMKSAGLAAVPGIGLRRAEAMAPAIVPVKGRQIAIAAVGIGPGGYLGSRNAGRPGMMAYNSSVDFSDTVQALAEAAADVRILSVHYGRELQVRAASGDVAKLRDQASRQAGIDLVVGHHAHVPAGIQEIDGRFILYGLGNFLHQGMRDMDGLGLCRDWGLLVRVHLSPTGDAGRLIVGAVEALPLTGMHEVTERLDPAKAHLRVHVLNHLADGLDDAKVGARGIRFTPQPDGSGLYCREGAAELPGRLGRLCRDFLPAMPTPDTIRRRIASSCGPADLIAAGRGQSSSTPAPKSAPSGDIGSLFSKIFGF